MRLRLVGLCARSEQCEADLRGKIMRAGLRKEDADGIIDFLRRERFIDDFRFARAFARDKTRFAAWGPAKIRAALMAKRIPSDCIREALAETESSDFEEGLMRAARNKARTLDLDSRGDLSKLCRHLMSRGFSYDDFQTALRILRQDAEESD